MINQQELTQEAFCVRSGITRATLSRTLQGHIPTPRNVAAIIRGSSYEHEERLSLLLALLRDEAVLYTDGAGIDNRHYIIAPSDTTTATVTVPPELLAEFEMLANLCRQTPSMQKFIASLVEFIFEQSCQIMDAYKIPLSLSPTEPPPPSATTTTKPNPPQNTSPASSTST